MSDNGVFILETKGPEFRVAHVMGVDAIYGNFNDDTLFWDGDMKKIVAFFRGSAIFQTYAEALYEARRVASNYTYLDHGICFIDEFADLEFGEASD